MNLLITGGCGFIGSNFIRQRLLEKGSAVKRLVNLDALTYAGNPANLADLAGDPRYVFALGSIGDADLVARLLAEHQIDAIVNFAAESHVDRSIDSPEPFIQTNVVGTLRLLNGARLHWAQLAEPKKAAFRFLHVSTDEVYGSLAPEAPAFTEAHVYEPNSPYAASKAVELVARAGLNSALSDLLLDAAQEVHGKASLLQKRGEFPVPVEREIKISEDALRFYKSGKSFLYRTVTPFWLASLLNRILVAFVPVLLVLIPAIRFLPVAYRLRIQLRLYRCYRPLLVLERDAAGPLTREQGLELLRRLDDIEEMVNELKVPASFADQFYGLRGHIGFVRARLKTATPA